MRKVMVVLSMLILGGILLKTTLGEGYDLVDLSFSEEDGILKEELAFNVGSKENMQGITYNEGKYYIGYDMKNNRGVIEVYSYEGEFLEKSDFLEIGHSAGLAFNKKDKHIYVANGGGKNPTMVYKVNPKTMKVVKKYDFKVLGNSALIAMDNVKNEIILHTAKDDRSEHLFTRVNMKGEFKEQIKVKSLGIPQGMEYFKGKIYFYTNNKISVIDMKTAEVKREYKIKLPGESEGITFINDKNGKYISYGYGRGNRIYRTRIEGIVNS